MIPSSSYPDDPSKTLLHLLDTQLQRSAFSYASASSFYTDLHKPTVNNNNNNRRAEVIRQTHQKRSRKNTMKCVDDTCKSQNMSRTTSKSHKVLNETTTCFVCLFMFNNLHRTVTNRTTMSMCVFVSVVFIRGYWELGAAEVEGGRSFLILQYCLVTDRR